jgi:2-oxoisovalerate dehydrogenase E1 component
MIRDLPALLTEAYRIRRVEESLLEMFSAGKIDGTVHTCLGQELIGLIVCEPLLEGDVLLSNHRCHGHYIARFGEIRTLIAELLGNPSGVCGGFGGSQHLYRGDRGAFFSSGVQGGQTPSAVGMALAKKLEGLKDVVVAFIGDGTLGEGVVYESFNLAAKLEVPVLYVLEDNRYAQSTSQEETLAGSVEGRARAFDLQYFSASGFEPDLFREAAHSAVGYVRERRRPALLHVKTYRLGPHSKGDDQRSREEIELYRARDPLSVFIAQAQGNPEHARRLQAVDLEVRQSFEELSGEAKSLSVEARSAPPRSTPAISFAAVGVGEAKTTVAKEINAALHDAMGARGDLVFLGEDLRDPYGGAFKISRGLSTRFPDRVLNMPISEAAIVGTGLGLALAGRLAVVEIMFGDFIGLAFDQIVNHAAKSREMYGAVLPVPLIVRTPMGGRRGYGATHSQSLEKHFLGVPGTDLFLLHPHVDARAFYARLCAEIEQTALVMENKLLYGHAPGHDLPPGYELQRSNERFPTTRLTAGHAPDITVVSFGGIGLEVEKAAKMLLSDEIYLDIFYPLHINGCSLEPIVESLEETGRLLFVEEGPDTGTLSAELMRRVIRAWRGSGLPKFGFVAAKERPIPAASYLEKQVLPGVREIHAALLEIYDE